MGVYPEGASVARTATLSSDGRYRYELGRIWGDAVGNILTFVMLNPSTADADADDPTIRRCVGFAVREGYTALRVVNLFAWRTPYPVELRASHKAGADVIGPENREWLLEALNEAADPTTRSAVIVGWGATLAAHDDPPRLNGQHFLELLDHVPARPHCLGVTKNGQPSHPLMLASDSPIMPWTWR